MGERIRRDRERRGLTQRELAEAIGMSETQVLRWENGKAEPFPASRRALERFLSRPVGYFEPGEADGTLIETRRESRANERVRKLIARIERDLDLLRNELR